MQEIQAQPSSKQQPSRLPPTIRVSKLPSRARRALTKLADRPSRTLMYSDGYREFSVDEIVRGARNPFGRVIANGGAKYGGAFVIEGTSGMIDRLGNEITIKHSTFVQGGRYPADKLGELRAERGVGRPPHRRKAAIASVDGLLADIASRFVRA